MKDEFKIAERVEATKWTEDKLDAIYELLSRNDVQVKDFDISGRTIGDEGAGILAEVLKTNTTLTRLDLSYSDIEEEGTRLLCEVLKSNNTLKELNTGCLNTQQN